MNKPKQYRINDSRVYGFYVVEMRNELNWEAISKPMGREAACSALTQLNSREESTKIVESHDLPQQGGLSRSVAAS